MYKRNATIGNKCFVQRKIAINPLIGKINPDSLKAEAEATGSQTIMFAMFSEFTAQSVESEHRKTVSEHIRQKEEVLRLAAAEELEFLRQVKDRLRYGMSSLVCN